MSEEIKVEPPSVVEISTPPAPAPASAQAPAPTKEAKVIPSKKVPTSGQSGPPIKLEWNKLNAKERKIVEFLDGDGAGTRTIVTIPELSAECFFGEAETQAQANSWTRNSLRRLVRAGWVEKFIRGSYRIGVVGRTKLKFVSESDQ